MATGSYWLLQSLFTTLPLLALSVLMHRAGWRGLWPTFPWALALLCGPGYGVLTLVTANGGFLHDNVLLGLLASWASGAYIAICLTLIIFAVTTLRTPPRT